MLIHPFYKITARRFNKALLDYASYGNVVGVKAMLSGGIDIQTKNEEGNTALHLASKYNYMELVKVLLESGAQPCNQNQLSKIPAEMTTDGEIKALLSKLYMARVQSSFPALTILHFSLISLSFPFPQTDIY